MICPECKSEFVDGIIKCPDCEVPLVYHIIVEENENPAPIEKYNYVCVYRPISSQEVAIIKMIMEGEAIPYFIKNDPVHKIVLYSIQGPGKIELYVAEQYAKDTIQLLIEELGHD